MQPVDEAIRTCPECGKKFDIANRAGPTTQEGAEIGIIYCSVSCKRRAGNRRNYQRHRAARLAKAKAAKAN